MAASSTARTTMERAVSILDQIGHTPLLSLRRLAGVPAGVEIYAKAEYFNPGGSVKDRPALNMILDGERTGKLVPGKIILDSTSGNTGIAYAMIGAAKGYHVRLCLPANASLERKRILRAYAADVILTDPGEGSDGAFRRCRELYFANPDIYFYPDQYNNPANWLAHYEGTGPEIWRQSEGCLTHFIAGLGTSGTFMGVGRRLREYSPEVRLLSVQPTTGFHGLEGLKHMATAIVPGIYDAGLADENVTIETEEAYEMVKRLAREEGLLVGISSGANVVAALQVARRLERAVIVTVFCDSADKYLSEHFWEE
jgi:cysteine synthase B